MTKAAIWAILILATGMVIAGLWWFRDILTQVALALILFLAIEAIAVHIRRFWPKLPHWAGTTIAIIGTLGLVGFVGYEVALNIGSMVKKASEYEARIDNIVASIYHLFNVPEPPPRLNAILSKVDVTSVLTQIGAAVQSVAGNTVFILIYLGFLFPAAARLHQKLDNIFPDPDERGHTRDVLTAIRRSMAQYLWVQTVLSAITTALTLLTLLALGLENAVFWAFLIFFLNYIPTIGSIIAVVLPTAFALVQFPTLGPVVLVAFGVGFWQFAIGNLVAPRMMGESLNLSSLVVLIALAFWGQLWGLTGAFLAAPLMVMIMLTLAQFPNTRWIAILLSEDGEPGVPRRPRGEPAGIV